jgi:type I restriction enzyme, S subunit
MKINSVNTVSLGEVLEYEQPTKYIVDNTNYDDEFEIPVLTAGKSFLLGYTNETHNVFSNVPVIIFDDFTTAFKYVDFPFKVKSSAMKILKANKEIADIRFLYYRMMKTGIDTELHKRYWISKYSKVKIPLPPLDQQKKIAAILDAADAYKQKTKALIEKYDELAQSLFLDMFGDPVTNPKGWKEVKLGNICGVGSSKRVFVDELVEDGIPFYRGTEVGKLGEGKSITPGLFITKEHYESLKEHRGIPKKGDLLMPSICPDGRIWVIDDDKEFYFKDGRVLWVEVDSKKINSIYLRYHMRGSFFANYNNIASGTTFAELKIVALKKMNIFYPDLNLQNQFAERVQAIEAQKGQAQASLAQAEDLFNSLLQKAFKGELA